MSEQNLPLGWDESRVKRLIEHYENMSEDELLAEDEAARDAGQSLLPVPCGVRKVDIGMAREMENDRILDLTDFTLVSGPLELPEPAYSFDDNWKTEIYAPNEIADAILAVQGVTLEHPAIPTWDDWRARWTAEMRFVEFEIGACEFEPDNDIRPGLMLAWGGSRFRTHCRLSDILFVLEGIRKRTPAVYLHNTDCRLFSPNSFAREFGS